MTQWQKRRAGKIERGECYQCPLPAIPGRTLCESHRDKSRAKAREYYRANAEEISLRARTDHRDIRRNGALVRQYGITLDEYNAMLAKQRGVCAICARPETRVDKHGVLHALAVDHCHATGAIRGLLCHRCNRVLGLLGDDVSLFEKCSAYLEDAAMQTTRKVLADWGLVG